MRNFNKKHVIILAAMLFGLVFSPTVYGDLPNKHGVERFYHGNGNLSQEFRYKRGVVVRKRTFYPNGKLLFDCKYKKGFPFVIKTFHKNGKLQSLWTRKSGVTKNYYPNGNIKSIVQTSSDSLRGKHPSSFLFSTPKKNAK